MKFLTILFISISVACWGQTEKKELKFSAYEKSKVAENRELSLYKAKQDSIHQRFLLQFLDVNIKELGIDQSRVSLHKDSTIVMPDRILLILKPKKK